MAVGAIAKTEDRAKAINFTHTFHRSAVQLLLLRPEAEEGPGGTLLFQPFSVGAWFLVIFAFLLVRLVVIHFY